MICSCQSFLEIFEGVPELNGSSPQFTLKLNAECNLPYPRDDLEAIRFLLALLPIIQANFAKISNLTAELDGFKAVMK